MSDKKAKPSFKKRFLMLVIIAFFFLVLINFYQGFSRLREKNVEIKRLETEIEEVKDETEELEGELEYLSSNEYVEKMARQELGLVKEGEMLYINVGDTRY